MARSAAFESVAEMVRKNREKQKTKQKEQQDRTGWNPKRSDLYNSIAQKVWNGGYDPGVTDADVSQFIRSSQSYFKDSAEKLKSGGWSDIMDPTASVTRKQTEQTLLQDSDKVRQWANLNRKARGDEWYGSMMKYLDDMDTSRATINQGYAEARKYYSQWETQDAYDEYLASDEAKWLEKYQGKTYTQIKTALRSAETQEEKDWASSYAESIATTEDREAELGRAKSELQYLERAQEDYNRLRFVPDMYPNEPGYKELKAEYDIRMPELQNLNLDQLIPQKKTEISRLEKSLKYSSLDENEDFSYYAAQGAAIKNPSPDDAEGYIDLFGWRPGADEVGNIVTYSRDNYGTIAAMSEGGRYDVVGDIRYKSMTEDEVAIYNYLLAKEGKEKAGEYLSYIEEDLNAREGKKIAGAIKSIDIPVIEQAVTGLYGLGAGLDQWASGTKQFFTNEQLPTTITQYANADIANSLTGFGKYAYTGANVVGNMLPSIFMSYATGGLGAPAAIAKGVGAATVGVSAAGNAHGGALRDGYSADQARTYGTLVGASEAVLQYILGGIGSLGGISDDLLKAKIDMIDNSLLRVSAKLGADVLSEVAEEELQNYLEPAFRSIVFGEDYDAPTLDEIIETAIVTAITTPVLGGVNTVKSDLYENRPLVKAGKYIMDADGGVDALMNLANEVAGVTSPDMHAALTEKASKVSQKATPRNVGKLYNTVQTANVIANASANQADIAKSLKRKGFTPYEANEIAGALVANYNGQELTRAQKKILNSVKDNKDVQTAITSILDNSQSTMGQRSQNIRDFEKDIVHKRLSKLVAETTPEENSTPDTSTPVAETAVSVPSEVSEPTAATIDSNTYLKDAPDTPVKIKEVASIKSGKMTLRLEDGREVDAADVTHGSETEAMIYSAVASLEGMISPRVATKMINHLLDLAAQGEGISDVFVNSVAQAYQYGYMGYHKDSINAEGTMASMLTQRQRNIAYGYGKMQRAENDAARMKAPVQKKNTAKDSKAPDGKKYGNVQFEGKVKNWGKKQQAEVALMDFIARELAGGVTVHVYESYVGANGKRYYRDSKGKQHKAPNGKYDPVTGDIYIDLNAGDHGEGLVLNTFGHELYHHIERRSPTKASQLAEFLCEEMGISSVEAMVERQIKKAENAGHGVEYFMKQGMSRTAAENTVRKRAFSDFVADSLETVFTQGNAMDVIQRLSKKDKGLVQRIKDFIDKWVQKLREFYNGNRTISLEGHIASQLKTFEKMQEMFMEALVDAGENFRKLEIVEASAKNSIANEAEVSYSRRYQKTFFKENVFPPYNESQSDAHEHAERWARKDDTKPGDRRLASYHGKWYLIQAFEDLKYGYQIMKKIAAKDYEKEARIYETITGYESLQSSLSEDATQYYRRSTDGNAGHRFNNDESGRRNENREVYGLGKSEIRREDSERNSARDHQSSNSHRRQPDGSAVDESFSDRNPTITSERDTAYMDAAKSGDVETAQKMVTEAAKSAGYAVHAYHGTSRSDRVGNVFLPERATSGPMAFFTSDQSVAEGYAKSKKDTSMAYDPDFDRYETQFRVKTKYGDMPIYQAWNRLPFAARQKITQKAGQIHEDWDGDNGLILDPDTNEANGGFQWQLKEAKGNTILALIEQWLNGGYLLEEEVKFLDVLDMAGVSEAFTKNGMGSLYFKDPNARYEKVYDTFLRINNPFDTANVDEEFVVGLEDWWDEQDHSKYARENMRADEWDKNGIDAYDFADRLRDDIERKSTRAWTSIPDSVVDYLKSLNYDGIKDSGGKFGGIGHTVWIPFTSDQVKAADPVTYDDGGNIIPLSERFNPEQDDIRFSDRNPTETSNRALLVNALESTTQTDWEKKKLQEYKAKIQQIEADEQKMLAAKKQIRDMSFAKGPRDEAYKSKLRELRTEALHAQKRLDILDKQLLRLEATKPLQDVLKREKDKVKQRIEQKYKTELETQKKTAKAEQAALKDKYTAARKAALEKTRENIAKRDARTKLQRLVMDTSRWLAYPAKTDVKCPDMLKPAYSDFLNSIDMSSKRLAKGGKPTENDLRLTNAMNSLATALEKITAAQDPSKAETEALDVGYLDLPADYIQTLRDMAEEVKKAMSEGDYVVNNMSAAEIKKLSQMIRTLNHSIKEMSKLYTTLRFKNVEELGGETISFMDELGEIKKSGGTKDFVQWDNALPYYAFKRFGKGGEAVFEGLMDAQDKMAVHGKTILDFSQKAWTEKEAKAWSEDTHTVDLPNGNQLTLTSADAMGIYCLSRRRQGLQHLLGGGVRVIGVQKGSKKASDSRSLLTLKDIDEICSSLTERQKTVAEAIQEFMSTVCAEWGNEISMKRFLTREFTEEVYYPIESNDENLTVKDPAAQQSDLFRLLNISATKQLNKKANNEVIIRNIFDVFSNHASDMARLNAYGMALLDYMKWFNFRTRSINSEGQIDTNGVRKSMEKAYGKAAGSYVLNLIKDVNGRPSDGGEPGMLMKWMRNAKTASVGNSIRVATLQVTSYPRAALVLSPINLARGLTKMPQIEKAKKYCGIALWKSFGFYDTNISRSIEDQIKGVKNIRQKLIELSLKGAEWGDAITWGALWNACEFEVAATKKYEVGSEAFNQAVGKKLREVVYRTQVVDSVLTRSQIMRSKRGLAQEAAAFMSEPTLSANILMDATFEFNLEKRRTGSVVAAWKKCKKLVCRSVAVYSVGQLAAALLEGLWDAWRDDDDEPFGEKFRAAFGKNLVLDMMPFNKVPVVSDLCEGVLAMVGVGYFSTDKLSSTWISQAVSAVDAWKDVFSGDSSVTTYNALYKSCRAISSYFGVSGSGLMREAVALWNNTGGAFDSTWKIRQYELSKTELGNQLYAAIVEGDKKQEESLRKEFEDEDSMTSALRKAIRENDPRIKDAAKARHSMDTEEYLRIVEEIVAEGYFSEDDVVAAVRSEYNSMKADDVSTLLYTAIASGDDETTEELKGSFINDKGKFSEESFQNAIRKGLRENEPRIQAAAEAKAAGDTDTYLEIVEDIVDEGHFKWKDVSEAVKDEVKEMKEG